MKQVLGEPGEGLQPTPLQPEPLEPERAFINNLAGLNSIHDRDDLADWTRAVEV